MLSKLKNHNSSIGSTALLLVPAITVLSVVAWTLCAYTIIPLPLAPSLFAWVRRQWLWEGVALLVGLGTLITVLIMASKQMVLRIPWWRAWCIWMAFAGCSILYSVDRGLSLRTWLTLLSYGLLAYLSFILVQTRHSRLLWACFFVLVAGIVSIKAFFQYFGTFDSTLALMETMKAAGQLQVGGWQEDVFRDFMARKRIFSVFGWPNLYAGFLLFALPLGIGIFRTVRGVSRLLIGALTALLFVCLVLTLSMGAWIATIITGFLVVWMVWRSKEKSAGTQVLSKIGPGTVLIAAGVVVAVLFITSLIVTKRNQFILGSTHSRVVYVLGALNVIKHYPLGGTGIGTFGLSYRAFMPQEAFEGAHSAVHAHNTVLEFGADLGLAGLFVFALFLLSAGRCVVGAIHKRCVSTDEWVAWGFAVSVLAFFIYSLLEQIYVEAVTAPFWWVGLGLLTGSFHTQPKQADVSGIGQQLLQFFLPAVVACVLILSAVRFFNADAQAASASMQLLLGNTGQALSAFEQAQTIDHHEARYPLENGRLLLAIARIPENAPKKQELLLQAQKQFQRTCALSPFLAEGWFLLGKTCWELKDGECARRCLETAVQRDANSRGSLLFLAGILKQQNRFKELLDAAAAFQRLEPKRAEGFSFAADAFRALGKPGEARQAFQEALKRDQLNPVLWFNYAQFSFDMNEQAQAADAYGRFLAFSPQTPEHAKARLEAHERLKALGHPIAQ